MPLAAELHKYLRFRHVFRYAYNVQLRWPEMADLVSACQGVLEQLEAEMAAFLKAAEDKP